MSLSTESYDFLRNRFRIFLIKIENSGGGAMLCELQCDGASNAAAGAGYHRDFSIQTELVCIALFGGQREMPRFQGIKSCWFFCSALVWTSPLATLITSSRTLSPICSMVDSPEIIGPVSMSMMSDIRLASTVLVESLITGATGFPVGVPRPVVKSTTLAPAPTCAVTHSTSFPGVHCRCRPARCEYSGYRAPR